MPGRNGTGPLGQGRLTGRAMGPCGSNRQAYGRGFGMGFGRRFQTYQATKEELLQEKEDLKQRLLDIEKELDK
ncbi:MAG: DUF5320 domain-containing protein [Candidatus Izemoplasmatales bacterium]|uniref:DUF5320 domain-containing protein n=1 Tax=Hujiaoplasma nucleasis TaxID=2725268 RepID=A0A7L6N548_9MOLU|nr:DUF5320 domain-containing protein [Hujiaoplasma nucleasis]QLY40691.1 DUF5320 domain-containing protein [Hujiaoplasma nucleasis]